MYGSIVTMLTWAVLPQVGTSEAGALVEGSSNGGDRFGYQVDSGDLDGDGSIDLVVAAPHPTGGNKVHVFLGPHDLDAEHLEADMADVTFEGIADSEFGWAVALGDVVGDGSRDVVISAPSEIGRHGRVHVFEGPFSPATYTTADAALAIDGLDNGYLGWAIATGDFDGDGKDELALGATEEGLGNPGAAYLFDADVGAPVDTDDASTRFEGVGLTGASLARAGDMNRDGIEELLIGSYGTLILSQREFGGAVSIVYGRAAFHTDYDLADDPIGLDIAHIVADRSGENVGYDIAPAGDVNSDGFDDILIGAPAHECGGVCSNRDRRGGAYIVLGAPDTAPGGGTGRALHGSSRAASVADVSWDAPVDDDWTGLSVSAAGYAGTTYSTWGRDPFQPWVRLLGPVMLFGTNADKAYAIPYDAGPRLYFAPKYTCAIEEGYLRCTLNRAGVPQARQIRRDLGTIKEGHELVGDAGSAFGFDVHGPGDVDGDGDGDLFFGAPHQVDFDDPAGDGDAYAFPGL